MNFGKIIGDIIGKSGGNILESVGNTVDKFIQTKEEKDAAKVELQKLVNEHVEKMTALAASEAEAYLKDVADARDREMQIATSDKAPLINKVITPVLAVGAILLSFILFYVILFKELGAEKDIIIYVLGAITAMVGQIFSYYFGSSSGSKQKAEQLDSLMKSK